MIYTWVILARQLLRSRQSVVANQMNTQSEVIKEPQQRGIMDGLIGNALLLTCHNAEAMMYYSTEMRELNQAQVLRFCQSYDRCSIKPGR